jgi:hypothetical protein
VYTALKNLQIGVFLDITYGENNAVSSQTQFTFHNLTITLGSMFVSRRIIVTAISALTIFTGIILGIYLDNRFIIFLFCCAKYVIMMPLVGYLFPNCWRMLFLTRQEYYEKPFLVRCAGEENMILNLIMMEFLIWASEIGNKMG